MYLSKLHNVFVQITKYQMQYILDKPWHRLRNRTNAKVCVTIALVVINFFIPSDYFEGDGGGGSKIQMVNKGSKIYFVSSMSL